MILSLFGGAQTAWADEDPLASEYTYTTDSGKVTITKYTGSATDVVIPATLGGDPVYTIGTDAFSGTAIRSVTIPDGVNSIGDSAFYNCDSLTSVIVPEGVTTLGQIAFAYCNNLKSVTLPDSITSMGQAVFSNDAALTKVNIPAGMTSIPQATFAACYGLKSIIIPNTIKTSFTDVADSAWYGKSESFRQEKAAANSLTFQMQIPLRTGRTKP